MEERECKGEQDGGVKKKVVELSVQSGVSSVFTAFIAVNKGDGEAIRGPLLRRNVPTPCPDPSLSHVVVLLLGEKQSGKSSAGNTILGKPAFHKKTTRSLKKNGTIFGIHVNIQVTVVDTPGWLSYSTTPDKVSWELCRGLTLCHSKPDVILLVLPITSTFGQEEWRAMEAQLRLLQTSIWQRAMLLFTYGDQLENLPIQEHIRRQGRTLHWLLERCGNRYQVMSNQFLAPEAQLTELFAKIQKIVKANNRPKEIQYRMYAQVRQEVSMMMEWRQQGRQEEIEMTLMQDVQDGRSRRRQEIADPVGTGDSKPALGLILLGRRKSGKTSACNIILHRKELQVVVKTTKCSVSNGEVAGWPVTVVDTPGWSLFGLADPKKVRSEISQSPNLCPGSKVCFLLVLPVDSFTEMDRRAVETYLSVLENDVWRSTVVLFTYAEELRGRAVEKHIEEEGEPLQWVLDKCGHRHHVLDTNTVDQLLQMVEEL
ncbi:GTPase IMAP family member 8 [Collichthys lucidus]|uniref:GTPase IMAP family member 8 n=1 Tax=Collichthys lucidus TaxID=240159 RepID=A0A4U5V2Q4_COLLU|nr:GTPase IMAP family member 8 [Collichthys lucidus]